MSLAKSYSAMKKAGHKMSGSGMCESCGGECKYSSGGGVHTPNYNEGRGKKGISEAGEAYRISKGNKNLSNPTKSGLKKAAIQEHRDKLDELKSMPNPKLKGLSSGGEIKGVHTSSMEIDRPKDRKEKQWAGHSLAGNSARDSKEYRDYSNYREEHKQKALDEHHKKLGELHAMPRPKLKGLAKGGEVLSRHHSKGVHVNAWDEEHPKNRLDKSLAGESAAGMHIRDSQHYVEEHGDEAMQSKYQKIQAGAKPEHKRVLKELKSMPKPKLQGLADGGPIVLDKSKVDAFKSGFQHAEGGEVDDMEMDQDSEMGDDSELMEACADELMKAIKSGNKKEFVESLKALIMSMRD